MTNEAVNLLFGKVSIQIFCPFLSSWLQVFFHIFNTSFLMINIFGKYFLPLYGLPFQDTSNSIYLIMARPEVYYPCKPQFSYL